MKFQLLMERLSSHATRILSIFPFLCGSCLYWMGIYLSFTGLQRTFLTHRFWGICPCGECLPPRHRASSSIQRDNSKKLQPRNFGQTPSVCLCICPFSTTLNNGSLLRTTSETLGTQISGWKIRIQEDKRLWETIEFLWKTTDTNIQ